jgi:hypothetical protein
VTIYVTGPWDTSGGSIINTDATAGNLHIYSTGSDFDFSGGSYLCAAIFAPNAEMVVTGGSHFYGSVIARSFNNGGGTTLHFDEALISTRLFCESVMTIYSSVMSWKAGRNYKIGPGRQLSGIGLSFHNATKSGGRLLSGSFQSLIRG